jgi:hypothetical protein
MSERLLGSLVIITNPIPALIIFIRSVLINCLGNLAICYVKLRVTVGCDMRAGACRSISSSVLPKAP